MWRESPPKSKILSCGPMGSILKTSDQISDTATSNSSVGAVYSPTSGRDFRSERILETTSAGLSENVSIQYSLIWSSFSDPIFQTLRVAGTVARISRHRLPLRPAVPWQGQCVSGDYVLALPVLLTTQLCEERP